MNVPISVSLSKDDVIVKVNRTKTGKHGKFLFVVLEDKVYYLNTALMKLWVTSGSMASLGAYHKKLIRPYLNKKEKQK